MTIEPHQPPPPPGGDPELPSGEGPSLLAILIIVGFVVAVMLLFIEFSS